MCGEMEVMAGHGSPLAPHLSHRKDPRPAFEKGTSCSQMRGTPGVEATGSIHRTTWSKTPQPRKLYPPAVHGKRLRIKTRPSRCLCPFLPFVSLCTTTTTTTDSHQPPPTTPLYKIRRCQTLKPKTRDSYKGNWVYATGSEVCVRSAMVGGMELVVRGCGAPANDIGGHSVPAREAWQPSGCLHRTLSACMRTHMALLACAAAAAN